MTMSSKQRTKVMQRLVFGVWVAVGIFAVYEWFQEKASGPELAQAGIPVSAALAVAAVIGIVASIIIFRTPTDGSTEL